MRKLFVACFAALFAVAGTAFVHPPVNASPDQEYDGPYFGNGNLPPGCTRDVSFTNLDNVCYHMKTGLAALDSPQVDVLVLVPASPSDRNGRIARQMVEMWEGGIDYMAEQMGLGWLADGMDFHVTVDTFDPFGNGGGEFTTYPIVDPEIVVVATNPVGGAGVVGGIGIDPVNTADDVEAIVKSLRPSSFNFVDQDMVPCHNVQNPFDFGYWENLPGFDRHHEARAGTYVEDCGGAGGNICFSITATVDPAPDTIGGMFNMFDVMAHEFGHCLTLGHVGDGAESTKWGPVPYNDIMSYSGQPVGLTKCVSTLDVEGVAVRMSRYLDVNGDGTVTAADRLLANDQTGLGGSALQVQHPRDHLFASATGSPWHCPQPDVGLLPGPPTNWTPTPVDSTTHALELTSPADGAVSNDGAFSVAGTLERHSVFDDPTSTIAAAADPSGDAVSPYTDILGLSVEVTDTELHATIRLADMVPSSTPTSPVGYILQVGPWAFTSSKLAGSVSVYPGGTSTWDATTKTVEYHISHGALRSFGVRSPYYLSATASYGTNNQYLSDDYAPAAGHPLGVVNPGAPNTGADELTGEVHLSVDGVRIASQDVHAGDSADTFAFDIDVAEGTHELQVDWEERGEVVATKSVTVTYDGATS